jgi:hypothetical protein
MANGKIIYPSGAASQVTYTFVKNYDYGHQLYRRPEENLRVDFLKCFAGAA